jgi:hypothetical protein
VRMKLELRHAATPENAAQHAETAVELFRREFELELDWTPASIEDVDGQIEALREEGFLAGELGETLFVVGCYLGEVMVRALGGRWAATRTTAVAEVSPWPMVVTLSDGSAWDVIGKVFRRFEIGDSEYLPVFFAAAAGRLG